MTRTTTYIDESTGEHLATVNRVCGQFRITISPRIQELLRACAFHDDVPEEITANVFFAHHCPDEGRAFRTYPVTLISETQCDAALQSLPRLAVAAAQFVNRTT